MVSSITIEENGLVRYAVPDGQRPESLPEGCMIEFSDVEGMYATDDATYQTHGQYFSDSRNYIKKLFFYLKHFKRLSKIPCKIYLCCIAKF